MRISDWSSDVCSSDLILVNAETELDQSVDSVGEGDRLIEREARSQEGGVVQQPDQVLDSLVGLVGLSLVAQSNNNCVGGVDLQGLLVHHVSAGAGEIGRAHV